MTTGRLEAFSDGVLAIIITIMVLELKVPAKGDQLADLAPLWPTFLSYILSFAYIGIYWTNHHHLLKAMPKVTGAALWANLHLLFWLSLVPFTSGWVGATRFAPMPTALYGVVLFMAACAYYTLQTVILAMDGPDSVLARAVGKDIKGKVSPLLYLAAIGLALVSPLAANGIYVLVALIWVIPDLRIERALADPPDKSGA